MSADTDIPLADLAGAGRPDSDRLPTGATSSTAGSSVVNGAQEQGSRQNTIRENSVGEAHNCDRELDEVDD